MKLYNRTKCPDAILRPLLVAAGRAVGARTSGVVVKVTQAKYLNPTGKARRISFAYRSGFSGRIVYTDAGWFSITLPNRKWQKMVKISGSGQSFDILNQADQFYNVAVHEWGHIKDYQYEKNCGRRLKWSHDSGGRRRAWWEQRPEEKRANKYRQQAKEKLQSGQLKSRDNLILELALWLDGENVKGVR